MTPEFAPLRGVRVLEIGDEAGQYCGKLLRDLGAEVVKLEPPGGVASRRAQSVAAAGGRRTTAFDYYNGGKRSVVVAVGESEGRARLRQLLGAADVLIDSLPYSDHCRAGLSREELRRDAPGLITVSISGYGRSGPRAAWAWTDLTALAHSGITLLCGDPALPPVTAPNQQAYHIGSLYGAVAVVAALHAPEGERGVYVDLALQECLATEEQFVSRYLEDGHLTGRQGSQHGGAVPGRIYPCADGAVYVAVGIGPMGWDDLLEWLGHPDVLRDDIWRDQAFRRENHDVVDLVVGAFAATRTRDELTTHGQAHGVRVLPLLRPQEFVDHDHVVARRLFPEVGGRRQLRPPYLFDGQALEASLGAPRLNADARRVEREWLRQPRPRAWGPRRRPISAALHGVRSVEFSFLYAGPLVGRLLADYGAEAIKVESATRTDPMRSNERGFLEMNRGKRSLTLNMKRPGSRELLLELLAHSYVLIENMNASVLTGWGIEFEAVRAANPGYVQIDMQGLGFWGPCRDYTTLGASLMAYTGMAWLWNHPSTEPPIGCQLSYPDYVGGLHGALAVLATLLERRDSGRGRRIELAQYEAAAAVLGPVYLDWLLLNELPRQAGNLTRHVPGGLYPCSGHDEWIAIETRDGDDWRRLCRVVGDVETGADPHLSSVRGRFTFRRDLDVWLAEWTRRRGKHDVAARLQLAGVPAAPVATARDLVADRHLVERGFLSEVEGADGARLAIPANPEVVDGTRLPFAGRTMRLGADTFAIATEILGLDAARTNALVAEGVLA